MRSRLELSARLPLTARMRELVSRAFAINLLCAMVSVVSGCGTGTQVLRPNAPQIAAVQTIQILGAGVADFTVINDRDPVQLTAAQMAGQTLALGIFLTPMLVVGGIGAIHSSTMAKRDEAHTAAIAQNVQGVSARSLLLASFIGALERSGRFRTIEILEQEPTEAGKADAFIVLNLISYGLMRVVKGDPDSLCGFAIVQARMRLPSEPQVVWDEVEETLAHQRYPLDTFKQDPALTRRELIGALEAAGQRLAFELLYPRGAR